MEDVCTAYPYGYKGHQLLCARVGEPGYEAVMLLLCGSFQGPYFVDIVLYRIYNFMPFIYAVSCCNEVPKVSVVSLVCIY